MDFILDLFIALCGVYLAYSAVKMKKTGELTRGIMVKKDADLSGASDIPGFISYMYIKTIIIGVCTTVCGIVGIINDIYGGLGLIQLVMTIVFFITVVIFGLVTVKAQKKYLGF